MVEKPWRTGAELIDMPPDEFEWLLWNLTCFPLTGWHEQLADYVVHGVPMSVVEEERIMAVAMVDFMGGALTLG